MKILLGLTIGFIITMVLIVPAFYEKGFNEGVTAGVNATVYYFMNEEESGQEEEAVLAWY